ncbi:MAG: hypothetical protein JW754_02765 [Candidatus Aenigmarchaeota archaeon]|nr:hypothetical protein [Candidatus Aenigmarchaeota archaeon]
MKIKLPYFNEGARNRRALAREANQIPYMSPLYRANLNHVLMFMFDEDPESARKALRDIGTIYREYINNRNSPSRQFSEDIEESFYLRGMGDENYLLWNLKPLREITERIPEGSSLVVENPKITDIGNIAYDEIKRPDPFFFVHRAPEESDGLPLIGNGIIDTEFNLMGTQLESMSGKRGLVVNAFYGNIVPVEQS